MNIAQAQSHAQKKEKFVPYAHAYVYFFRVATHQKVKNSLTFPDLLLMRNNPCLHSPSLFLQTIDSFLFIFNVFLLFAERGRRNLDESIHNENHWPRLLHVSDLECQIDCFAYFEAYFSFFLKENTIQNLEENLWTINKKTEFPDFSLTLTTSKIFPDFLKNSPTFPWPWKIFSFSWLFPDCGNPVLATLSRKIEDS